MFTPTPSWYLKWMMETRLLHHLLVDKKTFVSFLSSLILHLALLQIQLQCFLSSKNTLSDQVETFTVYIFSSLFFFAPIPLCTLHLLTMKLIVTEHQPSVAFWAFVTFSFSFSFCFSLSLSLFFLPIGTLLFSQAKTRYNPSQRWKRKKNIQGREERRQNIWKDNDALEDTNKLSH